MTGTSIDGIDCALFDLSAGQLRQTLSRPISNQLTAQLRQLCQSQSADIESMAVADRLLGEEYAIAVIELLDQAQLSKKDICAIGCHGQTIRHRPARPGNSKPGFTIQIGDANTLAQRTGITVVSDFRRRDIAAGGQGAPLAPAFHQAVFADPSQDRVVLNIGGVANVSVLPTSGPTLGYDTGPGNTLIDAWTQQNRNQAFDKDGSWARSGQINSNLLLRLLQHPFLAGPPPKSTGPEEFNLGWVSSVLAQTDEPVSSVDVQATLLEFTAVTISEQIRKIFPAGAEVFVCGGGANNKLLMERLAGQLNQCRLQSTEVLGIGPDWVEAAAFAWLAAQCIQGKPGNLPAVTGASEAVVLGAIHRQVDSSIKP